MNIRNKSDIIKSFNVILGTFIFALGINIFVVPTGLYSGGVLGLAQILRTMTERLFNFSFGFDISGIFSLLLNIPLLLITYKTVGKNFVIRTALCLTAQTIFLSFLPIKDVVSNPLTACIIGGILYGFGVGLILRNGGSSGGVDIIGMYFSKKSTFSVGRIALAVNVCVYVIAFFIVQDIEKIIYTLIYAGISMIALDRMHIQNINSEVLIISKHNDAEIQNALMKELYRGVSYWGGYGAYTGDESKVLYIVVSKYEIPLLRKIVSRIDPKAFISVKHGVDITGNFEKRL
jgi:uncharacterized membrane-anchored protein YitT (DUF2179 family)